MSGRPPLPAPSEHAGPAQKFIDKLIILNNL